MSELAQLALIAQQFGYEYADTERGGGPQSNGLTMLIVPDPSPEGSWRAGQNWARHPQAGDGVALPSLVPDEVELFKARIAFDLVTSYTEKQKLVLTSVGFSVLAVCLGLQLGADSTAVAVAGITWAVTMALIPVLLVIGRRYEAKQVARLVAAGYTTVTDPGGRLRYVPPGRRLPGHGNPFTTEA